MAMMAGISFFLDSAPNNSFLSRMNRKYVMLNGLGQCVRWELNILCFNRILHEQLNVKMSALNLQFRPLKNGYDFRLKSSIQNLCLLQSITESVPSKYSQFFKIWLMNPHFYIFAVHLESYCTQ